jgi:hypothetical protein
MINAEVVIDLTASQQLSPIRGGTKEIDEMDMIKNMNSKQINQVK